MLEQFWSGLFYWNDKFYWSNKVFETMFADMLIILALFALLPFVTGFISGVNASNELTKKDNPAFGISFAGVVIGVTIILTGAMYGNPVYTLEDSMITVATHGLIGVFLMAVTRVIFDKIVLPHALIKQDISKGNIAASFVDAGSVVGTAIIIRAVMAWVNPNSLEGVGAVFAAYVLSQLLLSLLSLLRIKRYAQRHGAPSLEMLIQNGNTAFALKFMGRIVGTAFVIAGASQFLLFEIHSLQILLPAWAAIALVAAAVLSVLSYIADFLIFRKVNIRDKILNQNNVALGTVQGAIYIALGLLLANLMT